MSVQCDLNAEITRRRTWSTCGGVPSFLFNHRVSGAEQNRTGGWIRGLSAGLDDFRLALLPSKYPPITFSACFSRHRGWITASIFSSHCNLPLSYYRQRTTWIQTHVEWIKTTLWVVLSIRRLSAMRRIMCNKLWGAEDSWIRWLPQAHSFFPFYLSFAFLFYSCLFRR